jgi:hypothetical protein
MREKTKEKSKAHWLTQGRGKGGVLLGIEGVFL